MKRGVVQNFWEPAMTAISWQLLPQAATCTRKMARDTYEPMTRAPISCVRPFLCSSGSRPVPRLSEQVSLCFLESSETATAYYAPPMSLQVVLPQINPCRPSPAVMQAKPLKRSHKQPSGVRHIMHVHWVPVTFGSHFPDTATLYSIIYLGYSFKMNLATTPA